MYENLGTLEYVLVVMLTQEFGPFEDGLDQEFSEGFVIEIYRDFVCKKDCAYVLEESWSRSDKGWA